MSLSLSDTIRAAAAQAVVDALNAGSGPAKLQFYTAPRPASGGAETTLVCECVLSDPAQSGVTNGVVTMTAIGDGLVLPGGVSNPVWARLVDSDDNFVGDVDISDCAALIDKYETVDLAGLFNHFGVSSLSGLLSAISAEDRALLGDIVLPTIVFYQNDYIRINSFTITPIK